jgi:hypothetical protein
MILSRSLVSVVLGALPLACALGFVGCGRDEAPAPGGTPCATSTTANDTPSAKAALAGAAPGACVILRAGSYAGPFQVPTGVTLMAQTGARATVTGGTVQDPALTLAEGAHLELVDVIDAAGVGIAVRASSAVVSSVTVSGAKSAALAVLCTAGAPGCASGTVALADVRLGRSTLGLWVSGAHVSWKGGASTGHAGTALSAAAGVVAQGGAKLDLENVTVEKNQGVGVLVDGATTTASIKNAIINENGERGVWAQRLAGTLEAPALTIEGTQVTRNRIVGVGALESHGIIIVSGRISDTVEAPLVTNLSTNELIGDGLGIFAGSSDLKIDTVFEANARTAGIIDGASERGIIIVSGKVGAGASGLKFVVQNTKANVQIPASDRSAPPSALGISAPQLAVPPVL